MVLIIERYPRPIAGTPDRRGSEGERERGKRDGRERSEERRTENRGDGRSACLKSRRARRKEELFSFSCSRRSEEEEEGRKIRGERDGRPRALCRR